MAGQQFHGMLTFRCTDLLFSRELRARNNWMPPIVHSDLQLGSVCMMIWLVQDGESDSGRCSGRRGGSEAGI